jgi:cytidylate kinase
VLDGVYLDTGAMYRAVTWAVLQAGADLADPDAIAKIALETELSIGTDPAAPSFAANGTSVDGPIRGPEVTAAVSAVAAVPAVRKHLVALQQSIISSFPRIIVEGRDIATVVAPDADLKVYLTASSAARAQRRSAEDATDVAATEADLARRDKLDSSRKTDPLRLADDAVEVDTTGMGIDEVVSYILGLLHTKVRS